jgi:hypothetical protein
MISNNQPSGNDNSGLFFGLRLSGPLLTTLLSIAIGFSSGYMMSNTKNPQQAQNPSINCPSLQNPTQQQQPSIQKR